MAGIDIMDNLLSGNQSTLKFQQWGNLINNVMLIVWRMYWEIHNDSPHLGPVLKIIYRLSGNILLLGNSLYPNSLHVAPLLSSIAELDDQRSA
ncbi:hypothetical protein T03_7769 [Trichinella britovi]|uniref:Uncharacterized protein n=1 Tax=Trichinella britovi TaxID=45882 RepID=A0A0V1CS89_TRIBR|nr:hypothetical protein T03_7769 [Trichinella britovi]